ncbi:MAG: hypothetical protein ACJ8MH_00350, partial [Povalibacter sp.]
LMEDGLPAEAWAAFVLIGDPNALIAARETRSPALFWILCTLVLVAVAFIEMKRRSARQCHDERR